MKRKLLSLLLVITLLAVTFSTGLSGTIFAENENLITNGDFGDGKITGWDGSLGTGARHKVEKNVQITDTLKKNALKITTSKAQGTTTFYHKNKIQIEKNTSYTMSFWVKMKNIKGFTTFFYEPDYTAKDGTQKSSWDPVEGQNIYTYSFDDGSTRVCRTDIKHKWVVAETGTEIGDANGVSMFITRVNGTTNQVLTPDYPNTSREGEWLQVIHTFTTGDLDAHEAGATYGVRFDGAVNGEIWLADFKMYGEKRTADERYTPAINDVALGCVSKDVPLLSGEAATITAEPFGENTFEGWFVDGECVSTEASLTFTYDPNNKPNYEARFKKADFGIDGSFETGYTDGQLLAKAVTSIQPGKSGSDWTPTTFLSTEKDGSGFVIDSNNAGKWREATITNAVAHTGNYSVKYAGQYGNIGYKFKNLQKNTDYTFSLYAYGTNDENSPNVTEICVTPANVSSIAKRADDSYGTNTAEALYHKWDKTAWPTQNGWTKISVTINSQNNTELIFWLNSTGTNGILYIDNISIARPPQPFRPSVDGADYGTASSETTNVLEGTEVTVVAESVNDGQFKGWYIGDELVSSELTFTFNYEAKYKNITAKFEKGKNSIDNAGLENYANGQELAVLSHSKNINATGTDWTDQSFLNTTKDGEGIYYMESNNGGSYRKAVVSNAAAHSGDKSILFSGMWGYMARKFTNLEKNTDYVISFYGMVKDSTSTTFGDLIVSKTGMTIYNPNGGVKSSSEFIARNTTEYKSVDVWTKVSIRFNSGDNTEVMLWINGRDTGKVYIDDFSLRYAPKEFKASVNNSGLGKIVQPVGVVECEDGDSITVEAAPHESGTAFMGWYVGDELISEDLIFTFNYEEKYQGLTAVFAGEPGTIPNAGLEYYQNGQVLASYDNNNTPKFNNNPPWHIDTTYRTDTNLTAAVTNQIVHSGEKAVVTNTPYRLTGLDIDGLKPNTTYVVSFWAYITGKEVTDAMLEANSNIDTNAKTITNAFVLPKGKEVVSLNPSNNKYQEVAKPNLGELAGRVDCWNTWKQIDVLFNTTDDVTDVTLWVNFSGLQAKLYMDDFSVFEPITASASADLGGSVSANFNSRYMSAGTEITVEATPYEGNTFAGWYDVSDNLISDSAKYTFVANESFELIAKFDGYNKPATDMFQFNGFDGTFENGDVGSWEFSHATDSVTWCAASVNRRYAFEGEKALAVNGRYRNSTLPLNGLTPNCDYRLSFYVYLPDTHVKSEIEKLGIIGIQDSGLGDAGTVFTQLKKVDANSGWNRVDIYFNSGNNTAAKLAFYFIAENTSNDLDKMFIDNMSLYRYEAEKEVVNAGFDEGKYNWIGDGTVVDDGANKVLSLGANESVYQDLAVDAYSAYTVSFKAKGKLTAAVQDISSSNLDVKKYLSSVSYVNAEGEEWNEYSFDVYSGVQKAFNIVFKAGENGAMLDDLKVTPKKETAGAIIEHIDFETDRFMITSSNTYSIHVADSDNDPYVYSGKRSLKFTYNELLSATESILDEGWLSYQPGTGISIKVTMKLRFENAKGSGAVNLAPEYTGSYGVDTGFEHMADGDDWQTINFFFNNSNYAVLKAKISSIAGGTYGSFYVDDIIISVTPPMVLEENSKNTYCERLYNAVDNEGFENPATADDWANLPSTAKITKGNALKGSHFLKATAGTHYVLPIEIKAGVEYYFAASIRGTSDTVGSIGISVDEEGTKYYSNRNDQPASIVSFDKKNTGWKRSGFKFTSDGIAYLVIDVKSGTLDIDSVMMFTTDYGYRYDPNDYTVYVDYDYDNLKSSTTVINGGFGDQPYYKGEIQTNDGESPSTGDSVALPVATIVLAVLASSVLMLIRKRKEGAENA